MRRLFLQTENWKHTHHWAFVSNFPPMFCGDFFSARIFFFLLLLVPSIDKKLTFNFSIHRNKMGGDKSDFSFYEWICFRQELWQKYDTSQALKINFWVCWIAASDIHIWMCIFFPSAVNIFDACVGWDEI
jgi:hypothetical protein